MSGVRLSPQQFQRESNIARVLLDLRENGHSSRSELADRIGIDRSTMTSVASQLLEAGLLVEGEPQEVGSRGGRPARLLSLADRRVVSAGISITDTDASWAVASLTGERIGHGRVSRMGERDPAAWIALALEEANEAVSEWRHDQRQDPIVAGVGVGLPGIVATDGQILIESTALALESVALAPMWSGVRDAQTERAIFDNDANCAAWNVAFHGASDEHLVFAHALFHRSSAGLRESVAGIGLALVLSGQVHYGSASSAGELRGYRWVPPARDQLGIERGADESDTIASFLEEVVRNVGVVSSVVDPDRVVLAGDLCDYGAEIEAIAADPIRAGAAYGLGEAGRLETAAPGTYSVELGAARMVLHRLFAVPALDADADPSLSWRAVLDSLRWAA